MAQANDPIEITSPSDGDHVDSNRPFVASGRADRAVTVVSGQCTSEKGPIDGVLALFHLDVNENPPCHKWMLVFRLPGPARYQLSVGGETAAGAVPPVAIDFTAEARGQAAEARGQAIEPRLVAIDSHSNGDNITAEASDFRPNGFLDERPLGVVTMTDSHGGIIYPDATFSDHVVLQFWSATFPPIPSETYTLYVADSIGSSVEVISGLTVD